MRNPLHNKKGLSYILVCVYILIVMMLVAVAMQYAYIYHVAREQQNETQLKLDSYVTRYAVGKYDALKQGEPWETYIDSSDLVDGAYTALGFPQNHGGVVEVEGKYVMQFGRKIPKRIRLRMMPTEDREHLRHRSRQRVWR